MRRYSLVSLTFFLAATAAFGQTSQTESQTLQALLTEVRGLREDLRANAVAAERLQILVYRLQVQQEATARALHEVDDAKSKLSDAESRTKTLATTLQRLQDARDENAPPSELKSVDDNIAGLKGRLEALQSQEQQAQATETQAEDQLRIEQSKVSELEDRLNEVDRALENVSHPSASQQK